MLQKLIQQTVPFVARIGSDPNDDDDIRLQKTLLVICAFPFMLAGVFWGLMYVFYGEPLAGAIPLSYSAISLLSIIYFGRQYRFFRFSQLALILLLPFVLMITLGGFVNGSAVVLWALISPLGAMLFDEPRHAPRWFLAFAILVVQSGFLQPYLRTDNNLSPLLVNFFFVINLVGVGSLVFMKVREKWKCGWCLREERGVEDSECIYVVKCCRYTDKLIPCQTLCFALKRLLVNL